MPRSPDRERIVSGRGSGGRLCWRATGQGIPDWKLIAADAPGGGRTTTAPGGSNPTSER
ncbi:hypothetical protein SBA2_1140001 [Acidobacteriia bacterium SbA2]|nr:hypothetical protein SBA2_1140001 [Acidobacteriia bacterium SbA2]